MTTDRFPLHVMIYGDAGSKKSTFAATFPKPLLVFMFDPRGKDRPYLRHAHSLSDEYTDDYGSLCQQALDADGNILIQLERYLDADPEAPAAYERFRQRMRAFPAEHVYWQTVVFDSLTYMELMARKLDQYKINKGARDGRQHYAASTSAIEDMLGIRAGSMPMNVVVCAHIEEHKDEVHGHMIYNPAAPGQQSKKLPAGFSELYRAYVVSDGTPPTNRWLLQTEKSALYNAASQIPAPNPCVPDYEALWQHLR